MIKAIILMIVSACLFRLGGMPQIKWCPLNQKLWRRVVLPIVAGAIMGNVYIIATYAITLNVFAWGENSLRKAIGKYTQWFLCGFAWGCSCIPYSGLVVGIISGVVAGVGVLGLMWWSNDWKIPLDQSEVEINTGWIIMSSFLIKGVVSWLKL